ncbi:chloramphenicol-sensitive protein RarD [Candidatus Planktophila lacus]|uniref:EamA family transporter RarD n=1 Tax=Candidatus Planktophila lacus TaxID=1884913 RepID=UPI000BACC5E1|nr:EamA family transporter RarD [Candidatus Planktophila lacus]ASY29505.1 chloramphenicol-sensitive protein RarD [Candidatus Planktophila lacus]
MKKQKLGLIYGVSAYVLWGMFPLYWPLLEPANPLEIVSHRAVWTLIFCVIVLAITHALKSTLATFRRPKVAIKLFLASILISINWLIYIWATNNGHVVEASLGYYINPLIIIAFGVILLKEKMRRLQWVAVSIATVGVIILTVDYGRLPWVALGLALSWGTYGLVKKQLGLGALEGLAIETMIAFIPYCGYLIFIGSKGEGQFGNGAGLTILLISAGAVTAIPLLLFNGSTTRLPYSTIGLLQYITPTIQFSIGVWVNHEAMPTARWVGFIFIWLALMTLATDLLKSGRSVDNSIA